MAIFLGCYPGEIALSLLVHLYVYKCPYFVVAFFVTLRRFLPPGSPSFLVIVLHFDLSSALSAHLDIGIPASLRSISIDSAHLMQGLPLGRPWYTQEDNNFLGTLSQLILLRAMLRVAFIICDRLVHAAVEL